MKWMINEFARKTGVTVRTLHYYDKIGLLRPACVDEHNGYRWYDQHSFRRMLEIRFYRELDFPLSTIKKLISSPQYDAKAALGDQKMLLIKKKEHIEQLIASIEAAEKGESTMSFDAFSNDYEYAKQQYIDEVRHKWSKTNAYQEYEQRTAASQPESFDKAAAGMDDIFCRFASCMSAGAKPDSTEAQALAAELQSFITANFYTCTKEILAGLGEMYCADERFRKNIDRHGDGTAQFAADAISAYTAQER